MSVEYKRVNWEQAPLTSTPINATNLNKMDEGIANVTELANANESSIKTNTNNIATLQKNVRNIENNLKDVIIVANGAKTVNIPAGSYQSVTITPTIPDGYSIVASAGFATNNLNVQIYNAYLDITAGNLVVGIKNTLSSAANTVTVNAYALCIKTEYI